jgi:hypothetical protein
MEYPTEDEIRAMTNREFTTLVCTEAERIDQAIKRAGDPGEQQVARTSTKPR